MQGTYVAYGLELRSSFPLPGMTPRAAAALPSLTLELRTPEDLEAVWSGPEGPHLWRGRLGDGCELTIEQGGAGDLLFTYADRARFRLDAAKTGLACAPSQAGLHWQQAMLGKVLPIVSVMRGYEGLHSGVLASSDAVVAIAGPSGAGKSTLAIELLRRGWSLFADDALMLDRGEDGVRAHPGTPHMNLAANLPEAIDPQALGETLGMLAGERWLAVHRIAEHPRPLRMVCLLERGPSLELATHPLPSNPLLLAPYMLGLSSEPERERDRFSLYADLMESATLMRLTAGPEDGPTQIADALERALARAPELVAEGTA